MEMPLTALAEPSFSPSTTLSASYTGQQTLAWQTDDVLLLHRIAAQDPQAFDIFYARYAPRLRGYLAHLLSDQTLVDEVCDDVMLVIWQHASRIPATVALWAWLCGIARHKARKAGTRASSRAIAPVLPQEATPESPESILLHQEYWHRLTRALDALPFSERTVLVLLVQHGCAYKDIATVLDMPVSTVRTRVSRACQRLRASCNFSQFVEGYRGDMADNRAELQA
jgi:RNA polymerase sigma-70 factor (ECF subfamily)